jgi:hypothetical protein
MATGFVVTVMRTPQFCMDGGVTTLVVVDGVAQYVDEQYLPMTECEHPRGRRPPGLASRPRPQATAIARVLAEAAHLEAASVPAFERLAAELAELGAPDVLVEAARIAAADEVRHAAAMIALGAEPTRVEVRAVPERDAFAIALDNAVEGCVHEAFAAVLCAWQASHAADRDVRRIMGAIADDECTHADLAAAIAAWLEPRLPAAARAVLDRAVARSLDALPARAAAEARRNAAAAATLGLPDPAAARALALAFAAQARAMRGLPAPAIATA